MTSGHSPSEAPPNEPGAPKGWWRPKHCSGTIPAGASANPLPPMLPNHLRKKFSGKISRKMFPEKSSGAKFLAKPTTIPRGKFRWKNRPTPWRLQMVSTTWGGAGHIPCLVLCTCPTDISGEIFVADDFPRAWRQFPGEPLRKDAKLRENCCKNAPKYMPKCAKKYAKMRKILCKTAHKNA